MNILLGVLCGTLTMVCWAIGNMLAARVVRRLSPFRLLLWGQAIGLLVLFGLAITVLPVPVVSPAQIGLAALTGVLTVPILWAFYRALQRGKLGVVLPVAGSYPVITLLITVLAFGEHITGRQGFAVSLVIAGSMLLATDWQAVRTLGTHALLPGTSYALLAAFLWGVQNALLKPLTSALGWFAPFVFVQGATVIAALIYMVSQREKLSFPHEHTGSIIAIGLLETAAFVVLGLGISLSLASIVVPISAAFALPAILLAYLFLKEKPTAWQLGTAALTIAGIVLLLT